MLGSPDYNHTGDEIEINAGRPTVRLAVSNIGDRAVQIGSRFDREQAYGMHLEPPGRHRRADRAGRDARGDAHGMFGAYGKAASTTRVTVDGEPAHIEPARSLPLNQLFFLA